LKDAAKKFGKKFACGASVIDDSSIEIQGEVPYDLMEYLLQEYKHVISSWFLVKGCRLLRTIL
jgi:Translation initiation factor 1 (eIF-1/SUI1) and related proteins